VRNATTVFTVQRAEHPTIDADRGSPKPPTMGLEPVRTATIRPADSDTDA
jgi:hypothetical protein